MTDWLLSGNPSTCWPPMHKKNSKAYPLIIYIVDHPYLVSNNNFPQSTSSNGRCKIRCIAIFTHVVEIQRSLQTFRVPSLTSKKTLPMVKFLCVCLSVRLSACHRQYPNFFLFWFLILTSFWQSVKCMVSVFRWFLLAQQTSRLNNFKAL